MENENSVCYVNRINKIESIEGADKIELVTVNGWTSVTSKGLHKEGDLILCITTDAVIPEDLAIKWNIINYLRKGNRVRTVKLKGVYSECILISLEGLAPYKEGDDFMNVLKIYKYEPPAREIIVNQGVKKVYFKWKEIHKGKMWKSWFNYKSYRLKNTFKKYYKDNLHFDKYYKFPNQKNVPHMFTEEDYIIITRKMHGTNARYGIVKKNILTLKDRFKILLGDKWASYEFVYGSHNVEKGSDSQGFYSTDVWKEIADKYKIKEVLWNFVKNHYINSIGNGIIIYGEIYGPGIQKNYDYDYNSLQFEIFDITINNNYLPDNEFAIYSQFMNLPTVEYLYTGFWNKDIQDSLVFNNYIEDTKIPHEGIVVKCVTGNRKKVSKVINPEYLTYGEKHGTTDSH